MTEKRVFIIGGTGFIGSHIGRELQKHAWEVHSVDRVPESDVGKAKTCYHTIELPDPSFAVLLQNLQPEGLVFSAGNALVRESLENPYGDFSQSTHTYFWILDQIRLFSPHTKVVFLSSAAVYGNPPSMPIRESAPPNPLSPYGFHKFLSETITDEYRKLFDLNAVVFRIFSVFGPGLRRQVVWDITRKLLFSSGREVVLFGTGQESRDFIAVEDLASIVRCALESKEKPPGPVNLASGDEISISDLAHLVSRFTGLSKSLRFSGEVDKGMPSKWCADVTLLRKFGWDQPNDFHARLKNTVHWIEKELKRNAENQDR